MLLSMLNSFLCTGFGLVLLWLILTPKVDDGVIIKLGMIAAMLGFLTLGWKMFEGIDQSEIRGVEWGVLMVNAGVLIVGFGYLKRKATRGHRMMRLSDWAALQDTQPMDEVDLQHVSGGRRSDA